MESSQIARNRLRDEKSPYLLQHAGNPVNWYPWGEEAFAKARDEDKPIFLSIGYATCHWCHVMAHESFEDEEIAGMMNDVFVSIKVDREERPDVDNIYMTICQLLTGSGGWPLTIIMTPEKKPFYAGTYFPKSSRFGRVGMRELIPSMHEIWTTEHEKALQTADQVVEALRQHTQMHTAPASDQRKPGAEMLDAAYTQLSQRFDRKHGGFGTAPKFPTPHTLLFLLRYWKRHSDDEYSLAMVEQTLQAMRLGGIYDHLGFGFHRYSTDQEWLLPHFEKMLYDQALLAIAYIEAHQATGKTTYQQTAREILAYVLRDMTAPEGGFYSAEDADSEGDEGKFYLWTAQNIRDCLDETAANLALDVYNVEEKGNFREQASGIKTGENILHLRQSFASIAAREKLEQIRHTLFTRREQRIHPEKDDKVLTDWNGLMIAALAKGAQVFDEPEYTKAAQRAATFILERMRAPDGRLFHRYRDGEAAIDACVDDYAFFIWGLIELYEATFDVAYLTCALELQATLRQDFWDDRHGGYYFTSRAAESLPVRQKEIYDGAIPSGNAVAMLNLLRLARLTGNAEFEEQAERLFRAFSVAVEPRASMHAFLILGADFGIGPTHEVVIAGDPEAEDTQRMLRALRTEFAPNMVTLLRPTNQENSELSRVAAYTESCVSQDGSATAYVCQNSACSLPTTSIEEMLKLLRREA